MARPVSPDLSKLFVQLVEQQHNTMQQLYKLLQSERHYLEQRKFKQYKEVLEQKKHPLQLLEQSETHLETLLAQFQLPFSAEGIEHFLSHMSQPLQQQAQKQWQQLLKTTAECQQLNAVNERIVFHTKQSVDRLLSLLKGQQNDTKIYQKNGKAGLDCYQACIAKA